MGCGAELLWRPSLSHPPSPLEGERMGALEGGGGVGREG